MSFWVTSWACQDTADVEVMEMYYLYVLIPKSQHANFSQAFMAGELWNVLGRYFQNYQGWIKKISVKIIASIVWAFFDEHLVYIDLLLFIIGMEYYSLG